MDNSLETLLEQLNQTAEGQRIRLDLKNAAFTLTQALNAKETDVS